MFIFHIINLYICIAHLQALEILSFSYNYQNTGRPWSFVLFATWNQLVFQNPKNNNELKQIFKLRCYAHAPNKPRSSNRLFSNRICETLMYDIVVRKIHKWKSRQSKVIMSKLYRYQNLKFRMMLWAQVTDCLQVFFVIRAHVCSGQENTSGVKRIQCVSECFVGIQYKVRLLEAWSETISSSNLDFDHFPSKIRGFTDIWDISYNISYLQVFFRAPSAQI